VTDSNEFKADFYRQTWDSMSVANRIDITRDEWVTMHINKFARGENNRLQQGLKPSNMRQAVRQQQAVYLPPFNE
jgi:hypothetical protein